MSQEVQTNAIQQANETSEGSFSALQGTSQEITTENLGIATSNRNEHEFRCPICLDTMKNTRITKHCFHRFCADCIITALRRGNKECPICRTKIISKRSLDPDPKFDELISKIYPSHTEHHTSHDKTSLRIKKCKKKQGIRHSTEKAHKIQSSNTVQQRREQVEIGEGAEDNQDSLQCSNTSTQNNQEAGPSTEWAPTPDLEHDSINVSAAIDPKSNGAC